MDEARRGILARRARFVTAAAFIGAGEAACAQTCLSVAPQCDADPQPRLGIEGSVKLCVGQREDLRLIYLSCDQQIDTTGNGAFTSSNPSVVSFDHPRSRTARAVGPGRATVTANFHDGSGTPTTHSIEVTTCSDAASDGAASD